MSRQSRSKWIWALKHSIAAFLLLVLGSVAFAQSVCLPAPRLLTVFPMGGQIGQQFEVSISGENLDELAGLHFSDPRVTVSPILDAQNQPVANRFRVSVAADMPPGLVEAFATARLGVSSSRYFSIGTLKEVVQSSPSPTVKDALAIEPNSTVNATMIARGANYYRFSAQAGQRIRLDCLARGIDSKLDPVLSLTTATGRVLASDRLGNGIDLEIPQVGEYLIKVHDLTFQGGPEFFYRLSLQTLSVQSQPVRFATTRHVAQYSWPPAGFDPNKLQPEVEPNPEGQAQEISLPCSIRGSFYPAADVDCYVFSAKKGEKWWIEVASHRLGAPTGPAAVIQRAVEKDGKNSWQDVLELKDIVSPMKVSSNNYAYDGPPYNGSSTDLIGMLDVPEDGKYRLQMNDLFGGTRDNPGSIYQLVIRQAAHDFALTGWVKHIELRNGDRNALSKPLALRPGATIALEVGAFRRDGFNGPIKLQVSGLPDGVSAETIDIPAGQTSGTVLLTADIKAPKGLGHLQITGQAEIDGQSTSRDCHKASMAWPIRDHWAEFPRPRLLTQVPVSVCESEPATITIQTAANENGKHLIQAKQGTTVSIPLKIQRRCDFSGSVLALNTLGQGFQSVARFEIPLQEESAAAKLDLAALKIAPGTYTIAFYGPAVAKYKDYPQAVAIAEKNKQAVSAKVEQLKQQVQTLKQTAQAGDAALTNLEQELKNAEAALTAAENQLKAATNRAQPQDIADIVVTRPFTLEVLPAEEKK